MLSTQNEGISVKIKRELKDYPLNKLYIALKIILISSTLGMQNAFAVDLPSAGAGCDGGTATCSVTSALGTDFTVISDITSSTNAINADSTVTGSTFTINSGVAVTGSDPYGGLNFATGSSNNTVTNNGTISGGYGINFNSGSGFNVVNNGTIDATGSFFALGNIGNGFNLTNNAGATISGTNTVIEGISSGSGATITNAGTISSDAGSGGIAILLHGDNNTINLNTTSVITGDVQLDVGKTNNILNLLGGTADTGTFSSYVNSRSINFLNIDAAGKTWNITQAMPVAGAIHVKNGNVIVTGALTNTGTGSTTLDAGTSMQLGDGGTSGSLNDNVINNGSLTFNRGDDDTFTGGISGTGSVVQAGAGTINLAGNGTWSGGTQVISGTLNGMGATNSLGSGPVSVINGATLQLGDASTFSDYYFSGNSLTLDTSTLLMKGTQAGALAGPVTYNFSGLSAPISLSNSTLDFEQFAAANLVFNGDVAASNSSSLNYVGDNGAHSLAMNGDLTGTGTFSINMSENNTGGSLKLAFNGAANNYTGTVSLNGDAYTVDVNTLLGQATWSISGAQTLNFNGANTHIINGLSSDSSSIVNITDADTTLQLGSGTSSGVIGGAGNLVKYSTGILNLNGVNTYTGSTKVTGGSVDLGVENAIASSSSVELDTGSTLVLKNLNQLVQDLSGVGSVTIGTGNLNVQSNTGSTFGGKLTGTGGLTKTGNGEFILSGTTNSVGATTVSAGNLHFTQNGTFNAASLLVNSGATAQLDSNAKIVATGNADIEGALNVALGGTTPKISAATATLGSASSLDITGFSPAAATKASDLSAARTVILQTTGGITGDFNTVTGLPASGVDYYFNDAKISADGNSYSVGSELAWTSGTAQATGDFTLTNAGDAFNVDVVLANETANGATWDGQSLTKKGAGNLTLSKANT